MKILYISSLRNYTILSLMLFQRQIRQYSSKATIRNIEFKIQIFKHWNKSNKILIYNCFLMRMRFLLCFCVFYWSFYRKRTCYINAGMTHNCDFKDLISAMNARRFWESTHSPGRRKRDILRSEPKSILLTTPKLPLTQ